jgi:O-antigen ligase
MIAKVVMLIAIFVAMGFMAYMLFTKEDANKAFIKYVLFVYPFLGIDLIPSIISFNVFDFLILVFLILFHRNKIYPIRTGIVFNYLFLFFILNMITGIYLAEEYTRETTTSIIQVITLFVFIRIFVLELLNSPSFKGEVLILFRGILIFSFLFLLCQFVFGPSFSFAKSENINVAGGVAVRYPSFFQDPQKYAQFLAALSFLMLLEYNNMNSLKIKSGILLAVISILALMLTGGRAGLGGWLAGVFLILFFGAAKYKSQLIIGVLILGLFAFYFQEQIPIFKRADIEESYLFRQNIWNDALKIHENHQLFGIGLGNYANYVSIHNPDQYWIHENEITFYDHPESGYLKILVEQGFFGFGLLFLLILYPIYYAFIVYFKTKNIEYLNLIAGILSWMIGFYTVYSLGDVRIRVLVASIFVLLVSGSFNCKAVQDFKQRAYNA